MKDARGFHEENGPFIEPLFFVFEDFKELCESPKVVINPERLSDQIPLWG